MTQLRILLKKNGERELQYRNEIPPHIAVGMNRDRNGVWQPVPIVKEEGDE